MVGQYGNLDSRDIVADFYPEFEGNYAGSWARKLAWVNPDTVHETEQYRWLGAASGLRQWVGARAETQLNKFSYSLTNMKYEDTMAIPVDDLRRDKTGQLRVRIMDMGSEAGRHDESLASTLLSNGATSGNNSYDGVTYFNTAHVESGTAQKNLLAASEIPAADVVSATAPTGAEMSLILLQTVGYMYGYTNDKGNAVNGTARAFTIMAGTSSLWGAVIQAIRLNNLANGTIPNNPLTAINDVTFDAIYNPALSAITDKIFVFRTDGKLKPLILQYETGLQTQYCGEGSDEEFKNDRHLFGLKWVKAAGYGMWQHAARVTLS